MTSRKWTLYSAVAALLLLVCPPAGAWLIESSLPDVAPPPPPSSANVLTRAYDVGRTGWNNNETYLTPANVAGLAQRWTVKVDDEVDAAPLVLRGQAIASGTHDVLYIMTANNTVYAFDAQSGASLLSRHISSPVGTPLGCVNNGPHVGITGTPVIDQLAGLMYFITYNSGPSYTLHAINVDTLADVMVRPVSASAPLAGGGTYSFNAASVRQRPALLEANGNIYAAFGSFCDNTGNGSRGWILGWNAATLAPLPGYLTNKENSHLLTAIWMSGSGLAADPSGNVYAVTANNNGSGGYNNPNNLSESIIKLSPGLSLVDHWTDPGFNGFDGGDGDKGSGGVTLAPIVSNTSGLPLAVIAGKSGTMNLLNVDSLASGPMNSQFIGGCWCAQSYFLGWDGIGRFVSGGGSTVGIWQIAPTGQSLTRQASIGIQTGSPYSSSMTSVSSNGTTAGSYLVWPATGGVDGAGNLHLDVIDPATNAILHSDTNAGRWNSRDSQVNEYPVVSGGMVYLASYQEVKAWTVGNGPAIAGGAKEKPLPPDTPVVRGTVISTTASGFILRPRHGAPLAVYMDSAELAAAPLNFIPAARAGDFLAVYGRRAQSGIHALAVLPASRYARMWPQDE